MVCSACGAENDPSHRFCSQCGASLARECGTCGSTVPAGARFCPTCGTALAVDALEPARAAEERKVISVLFADLVGFTAHTEQADPEDVRARLTVYHRRIREDVERFGGRIEKLMGDGAFAVFGAPIAHEDDPERAVRAALRIQQSVDRLNEEHSELALAVRIAVTTGRAVVQLESTDQDREGIIGDVVNTASRLQSVASAGAVVADERTYLASRTAIDYRPLDPVSVKGKEQPISIWEASGARSRFGVAVDDETATPFVGRKTELSLLVDAFDRTVRQRAAQVVTITGEPGVGKSRLLREFRGVIDERPDLVWWRQGRCLPYGEGITFWALGEVVKAQAGILESETAAETLAKLHGTVAALVEDATRAEWIEARLAPLVGAGATGDAAEQAELFKAWLQFFEALAARNPLILLVEDAHWADQPMLDFLEYLVDWAIDSPILIVLTARPELFTDHEGWGGGKRNAATISLSPLSDADAAALLTAMLPRSVMAAEAQQTILERCGGNPLYVTEFVRYAADRGVLDDIGAGKEIPLPDSVQALIAARLDLLDKNDKAVLQAAAVVGRVFWTGVLSSMRPDLDVRSALRRLVTRELVRPVRESSMRGQEEHKFFHSLIQDVAYGQIPRTERASLHEAAGRWLEAVSGERAVDVAELLAHHLTQAVELGGAGGDLAERAYRFLMLAGDRARELDAARGADYYRRATEIAPRPVDEGRALLELADVTQDKDLLESSLEKAYSLFETLGDLEGMALARARLAGILWWRGDAESADRFGAEATRLVADRPTSAAKAEVMTHYASNRFLRGKAEEALEAVERAKSVVDARGTVRNQIGLLFARGGALCDLGDRSGLDDLHQALRLASEKNLTRVALVAANNLATVVGDLDGPVAGLRYIDDAIEMADERGYVANADWNRMTKCELLVPAGRWDEVLELTGGVLVRDRELGGSQVSTMADLHRASVLFYRGREDEAGHLVFGALDAAREVKDQQMLAPALAFSIVVASDAERTDEAQRLIDEYEAATADAFAFRAVTIGDIARIVVNLSGPARLEGLIAGIRSVGVSATVSLARVRGSVAAARGDLEVAVSEFLHAADTAEGAGARFRTTLAQIAAGRCLVEAGRAEEAGPLLGAAREAAGEMGATKLLDEVDVIEGGGPAEGVVRA
jgi:class 3 adenylate cyclase/tetratricopeptide (TPR) repeat protein